MYKNNEQNLNTNEEFLTAAMIPYIHSVSKLISCILRSVKIRTMMRPQKKKWSIVNKAKDKLPAEEEPSVV